MSRDDLCDTGVMQLAGGQRRREARRQHILSCAAETFLRDGYRRATMEHLAAAAGVSKQTLYNYFSDKDELFASLLEMYHDEYALGEIVAAFEQIGQSDSQEVVLTAARSLFRYASTADIVAKARLIIEVGREAPELIDALRRRFFLRAVEAVGHAVEAGVAAGRIRTVDGEAAAYCLLSIAAAHALLQPTHSEAFAERFSTERLAQVLADVLGQGLIAKN